MDRRSRKERKRAEAEARNEVWAAKSWHDQLAWLNANVPNGAKAQKARIRARIARAEAKA